MQLVILLDLNHTLVENSTEKRSPFIKQIEGERYRKELFELIKGQTVVLITARPVKYRNETLSSIIDKMKTYTPFIMTIFNDTSLPPALFKRKAFKEQIQPKFPDAKFIAIESNPRTIAEYKKLGILCLQIQ